MNSELKELKKKLDKAFGTGDLMVLDDENITPIEVVPTGILSLDKALGVGGIPRGRIVEVFGNEATGKTSLALYIAAAFQKHGGVVAYVDLEHSLDLKLSESYGVNINELVLAQPMSAEEGLDLIELLVRSGNVSLIVIDSVAALIPQAEIDGEFSDSNMGLAARLMGKCMRKLNPLLSQTKTTLLFINQQRQKIGVVFGSPYVTTGGHALKYYATIRAEVKTGEAIKDKDKKVGHNMIIKLVKNKVARPFTETVVPLYYGMGFDIISDIRDYAVREGIITLTGRTYEFKGEKIASGESKCSEALINNPDLVQKIVEEINNVNEKDKKVQELPKSDSKS